ncbi:MFS transporter [Aminobacter sp. AP02]|uniref:MFS transporter n=1 Tax=Aminobacter sp. AP02 TaxID=2135737 RepID=UPI000D6A802F|nr:MFS transporter [Aminobacter sp. AP02]PWK61290.1 putative MFS family arabinose efflux permease [Aminobacter sp. AP02]
MTAIEEEQGGEPAGVGELWRNRDFLLYLASRGLMVTGRQILSVAVGWDVYARTGNVVDLGLIGLCLFFPILVFFIPAGVTADRVDRRLILGSTQLVQAFTGAAIGLWFHFGDSSVSVVFLFLLLSGSAHAFLNPALNSALPKLVPRHLFSNAVASSSSVSKIAQLVGPVGGGFLIALPGQAVYMVVTLMFLLGALAAIMIRANLRITEKEPWSYSLLFGGFGFIWATPKVLAAMSIDLIAVLFGGLIGMLPVYAVDILHVGPQGLGIMRAAPAVGAFTTALALASYRLPWPVGRAFFMSIAIFGCSIVAFSFSTNFWFSLVTLVVYGASDMVSVYVRQTLIQIDTPDELRGRVSAVSSISAGGSTQLGDFRAGIMAGAMGTPAAVAAGGLLTLAATALWYRLFPELRKLTTF